VFHDPHPGQRPTHLGLSNPHAPHVYTLFAFAICRFLFPAILFAVILSCSGKDEKANKKKKTDSAQC
jgi:hypothetical protein